MACFQVLAYEQVASNLASERIMACFQAHKMLLLPPSPCFSRTTILLVRTMCSLATCLHAKPCSKSFSCNLDECLCPKNTSNTCLFAGNLGSYYRNSPMFKFSDGNRGYLVIPVQDVQESSLFISPIIPAKGSLEPSGPTWTTITYSAIVLAMCKYILFVI